MVVGQVEDDAMMVRGRNEVSLFLVFAKILVNMLKYNSYLQTFAYDRVMQSG
jgi:hypothetical protein